MEIINENIGEGEKIRLICLMLFIAFNNLDFEKFNTRRKFSEMFYYKIDTLHIYKKIFVFKCKKLQCN